MALQKQTLGLKNVPRAKKKETQKIFLSYILLKYLFINFEYKKKSRQNESWLLESDVVYNKKIREKNQKLGKYN